MAHAYIKAIADAGADAVKFQCHIAEAESTPDEPWRVEPQWPQDANRYAYWKRMEFSPEQWWSLAAHAESLGLVFLCSPFSVEAVKLLDPLVPAWKVPSGEVTNRPLLEAIATTRKPAFLSTGMGTEREHIEALRLLWRSGCAIQLMQCTSTYPCPPAKIGLEHAASFRGLSDHSGTIYAGLAAVALGCDVLEVHVTFSRQCFGFDVASSITTAELRQLVQGVRFIERAKRPADKDALARELEPMRDLFLRKHERAASRAKYCLACDAEHAADGSHGEWSPYPVNAKS
jgi:N,N'-diacetyllegionaminate synthase